MRQINTYLSNPRGALKKRWTRFWLRRAGLSPYGRLAAQFARWYAPPHKGMASLARMSPRGYIAPDAVVYHSDLRLGSHVLIGERVTIFQQKTGGPMELGDRVCIYRDSILETGFGGSLRIEADASIHPRCQINAYVSSIRIGRGAMLAPNCALYPYDHGVAPNKPIRMQPLDSKGNIDIGDEAWLGFGVIVLGGVRIGTGAVVGAGSIVTQDIPDGAVVMGAPAQLVNMRSELPRAEPLEEEAMSLK